MIRNLRNLLREPKYTGCCNSLRGKLLRGVFVVLAVIQDNPVLALHNARHATCIRTPTIRDDGVVDT